MLPEVNRAEREEVSVSELVLGVKCGGSDGFSGISANPSLGRASDLLVRSGGTVLITEIPEFCGAEHILANRAKDATTGRAVYRLIDWYKEYASKFGAVLNQNPSPGNIAGGLLNITIKSLGAMSKAGTTRVEGVVEYAETPKHRGLHFDAGPWLRSGIHAWPGCLGSHRHSVHDRTRYDHRKCYRAGDQVGVKHAGFRTHVSRPRSFRRRRH